MTKTEYLAALKPNQVLVDTNFIQINPSEIFAVYRIDYVSPPVNFKLVHTDPAVQVAVLEDLDYVAPTA